MQKVLILDVCVDGEGCNRGSSRLGDGQVPVHIRHTILEKVYLYQIGKRLGHAHLQTRLVIRHATELDFACRVNHNALLFRWHDKQGNHNHQHLENEIHFSFASIK